jgi:hypothetical protein
VVVMWWSCLSGAECPAEALGQKQRSTSGIQAEYKRNSSGRRAGYTGIPPKHVACSRLAPHSWFRDFPNRPRHLSPEAKVWVAFEDGLRKTRLP